VLTPQSIDELRCALVVGAANDVLSQRSDAALLADLGIVYVPDFVANAGGVIQIHAERASWDQASLSSALAEIGHRTSALLDEADRNRVMNTTSVPLHVAENWASARLGHIVTVPD
jgi:leucine dehydrogenase